LLEERVEACCLLRAVDAAAVGAAREVVAYALARRAARRPTLRVLRHRRAVEEVDVVAGAETVLLRRVRRRERAAAAARLAAFADAAALRGDLAAGGLVHAVDLVLVPPLRALGAALGLRADRDEAAGDELVARARAAVGARAAAAL